MSREITLEQCKRYIQQIEEAKTELIEEVKELRRAIAIWKEEELLWIESVKEYTQAVEIMAQALKEADALYASDRQRTIVIRDALNHEAVKKILK
jgi:hypothetical protein